MLAPYRVLDLSDERGQLCGQILADLGADVIVIEPPGGSSARRLAPYYKDEPGPENSLYWWTLNRGKRGIVLDIESEHGRDTLKKLVKTADFLVESFEPGRMAELGLGYEELARINPRLVVVSITAFGQDGPKAKWAANDLTALAASGALFLTGDDDRPPVRVAIPQAFLHASAEAAANALVAHIGRERDGLGQHVDVSAQAAAMMATQSMILSDQWNEQQVMRLSGGIKLGPIQMRIINPCKDGYVSVTFLFGTAIGPFTRRLMEVMYEQGYVDEATRDKDWIGYTNLLLSGQEPISELQRCIELITGWTKAHTKQELFELAMERGLLIVPVTTTEDLVKSEQLAARDYWRPVEGPEPGTSFLHPGPFAKFSETPITYQRRAPRLGEHTDEILAEIASVPEPEPASTPARATSGSGRMPLEGIKVLDFMWVMAGPMGSRYLADYGATHIRVDSAARIDTARTIQPFKDGQPGPNRSGLYANVNAGKLGLSVNMANPAGRELIMKLVKWADVVLESYSPRAMKGWGCDFASLRQVKPDLIMLSSCLNGQDGPHAKLAGFGTMGAQLAGFGELAGWPDRPPAGPFGAYTDYIAPKFTAAAILAALDYRRRTGVGQYIDLSQAEASLHFLGPAFLDYTANGRIMRREGNDSRECAPHGVYPCRGTERWAAIAAPTDEEWAALCRAAGHAEWARDPRFATMADRLENRRELDVVISEWSAEQTVGEIEETLQAAGVPVHRASTSADATIDPQLTHRQHFVTVEHPELGPIVVENARAILSATPAKVTRPGPTFGQDNEYVLRELLGLDEEAVTELIIAGALE